MTLVVAAQIAVRLDVMSGADATSAILVNDVSPPTNIAPPKAAMTSKKESPAFNTMFLVPFARVVRIINNMISDTNATNPPREPLSSRPLPLRRSPQDTRGVCHGDSSDKHHPEWNTHGHLDDRGKIMPVHERPKGVAYGTAYIPKILPGLRRIEVLRKTSKQIRKP